MRMETGKVELGRSPSGLEVPQGEQGVGFNKEQIEVSGGNGEKGTDSFNVNPSFTELVLLCF